MYLLKHFLVFLAAISALFQSCTVKNDCEEVMCTMEFRAIGVHILDNSGAAISVDAIKLFDANTNSLLKTITTQNSFDNSYTLISDGESFLTLNQNKNVKLEVIKNSNVVKTGNYVFTTDCCHVSKVSGADTITIN